ncbi:toxin-antitoxin system HicB family antitoxin [Candidatus Woesearchaeota archaeon]|nr:toxin-antitoxin system HicB family antitoxin [Candidatus Woesearchaeota archaeon]
MKRKRRKEKRVNLKLPEELHTKAKIVAVLKDLTLNDYIERAVREAIEKDEHLLERVKELIEK